MKDIITVSDLRQDLLSLYRNGTEMGDTTHFPVFDRHFRWLKQDVVVLAGIGNLGKSTMLMQLLVNKVVFDDWRVAMFSPEQAPPVYFFTDIAQTKTAKSTQKQYQNYMKESEFESALDWLDDRFFYVYPETDLPTPEYMNAKFEELIINKGVNCVVVDPFASLVNSLEKTYGMIDRYVTWFLQNCKRFAQKHNVYYIIVTHPNSTVEREKDGNFKMLDPFHISGGIAWMNFSDVLMIYHRPFFATDPANPMCILKSLKIKKQRICGIPGSTIFYFDRTRNRFYEIGDFDDEAYSDLSAIPFPYSGYNPLDNLSEPASRSVEIFQDLPF